MSTKILLVTLSNVTGTVSTTSLIVTVTFVMSTFTLLTPSKITGTSIEVVPNGTTLGVAPNEILPEVYL